MEGPIDGHDTSTVPGERVIDKPEHPAGDSPPTHRPHRDGRRRPATKTRHGGRFRDFCDEGAGIGGTAQYPTPMAYLAMATGF